MEFIYYVFTCIPDENTIDSLGFCCCVHVTAFAHRFNSLSCCFPFVFVSLFVFCYC